MNPERSLEWKNSLFTDSNTSFLCRIGIDKKECLGFLKVPLYGKLGLGSLEIPLSTSIPENSDNLFMLISSYNQKMLGIVKGKESEVFCDIHNSLMFYGKFKSARFELRMVNNAEKSIIFVCCPEYKDIVINTASDEANIKAADYLHFLLREDFPDLLITPFEFV